MLKKNPNKSSTKPRNHSSVKEASFQGRLSLYEFFVATSGAKALKTTLTGFITFAISKAAQQVKIDHLVKNPFLFAPAEIENLTVATFAERIWDKEEAIRFIRLAQTAPLLLSAEEDLIWKAIDEEPSFWLHSENYPQRVPYIKLIKAVWNDLQLVADEPLNQEFLHTTIAALEQQFADEDNQLRLFDSLDPQILQKQIVKLKSDGEIEKSEKLTALLEAWNNYSATQHEPTKVKKPKSNSVEIDVATPEGREKLDQLVDKHSNPSFD